MRSVDCNFDENMCLWTVEAPEVGQTIPERDLWRYATRTSTIQTVYDHTYGHEKGIKLDRNRMITKNIYFQAGFVFIDSLNGDKSSILLSPKIVETGTFCLTFYFTSYYVDGSAYLKVSR